MPITGLASFTVQFTDVSSGAVTAWLWEFGDGGSATTQNPLHTYQNPGVYYVTLHATIDGQAVERSDYVNVTHTDGLTDYWPLSEESGDRVNKIGSPTLTENGTVDQVLAVSGYGADFTNGYLLNSDGLVLAQDFTMSYWFRVPNPTVNQGLIFQSGQLNTQILASRVYFQVDGWAASEAAWPGPTYDDGIWHHVIAWVDTTVDMFIHISIDGAASVASPFALSGTYSPASNPVIFTTATATGVYMQRVAIWNRALSAQERAARYNSGAGLEEVFTPATWVPPVGAPLPGDDPQVMLNISNDGGKTWIAQPWRSAGKQGEYLKRVRWNRLGAARRRVFEVSVTDPVAWKCVGAYLPGQGNGNG